MKRTFIVFATFFIIGSSTAQTNTKPAKATGITATETIKTPEALGLKENEYDFGKIPQGKPVTHVFEVVNYGTDSLKISNVAASCGCTTPEWERNKAIEPNGSSEIKVGYNAASPGTFAKTITITYNDGQTKVITIKGEVWSTPASSAPENKTLKV
jgi:hypothetical protein